MKTPDDAIGLCASCRHCRIVQTERSTFYLCGLSFVDDRFRKYPPLPVLRCEGYDTREAPVEKPDTPRF